MPLVKSVYHEAENPSYLAGKVWDIPPNIYKNIDGLKNFKKAIKNGNLKIVFVEFVRSKLQMSIYIEKNAKYQLLFLKLIFSGVMMLN